MTYTLLNIICVDRVFHPSELGPIAGAKASNPTQYFEHRTAAASV